MKSKGAIIAGALIGIVLGSSIAIASVLIFFYVFKVNVDLQMREGYFWNKLQEIPLDLFSMSLDDESFVYKMNKVYYLGTDAEKEQLRDKIDYILDIQVFNYSKGLQYPLDAVITIAGIELSKQFEGCKIEERECEDNDETKCHCYCSSSCGKNSDTKLSSSKHKQSDCEKDFDVNECIPYLVETQIKYSAKYPFPLTFSGTEKFVDELSYDAIEEK